MNAKRHLSYARGYLELGLVEEAAAELERVPFTHEEATDVTALRLAVLHEQRAWPQLATLSEALVHRNPLDASSWVTWAYATRRAHTLAAAERILLKAEQHHPEEPTIQFNLGCYACLRGDLDAAQRRVDRAVSLDPQFLHAAATDPDLEALRNK